MIPVLYTGNRTLKTTWLALGFPYLRLSLSVGATGGLLVTGPPGKQTDCGKKTADSLVPGIKRASGTEVSSRGWASGQSSNDTYILQ